MKLGDTPGGSGALGFGRGTFCFCIGPKLCQGLSFHYLAFLPAAAAQEAGLSLLKILFIVPF